MMTSEEVAGNVHNQPEFTVSEISNALKRTVEDSFGFVRVRGEISGLKQAASGHVYFSLKDENAVLNGICWRGVAERLNFKPEDGLEVICSGKISTYPGRSNYQIIVDLMEPAGVGALMALLEKRKKEFEKEGLFDPERKKPLPFLPQKIGVITSETGAVIKDILHRLEERFPTHVLLWPVLVQGEGAAEQVTEAIKGFNQLDDKPDLLIVARGGGSLEDLWAFNEEIVVRAASESEIPLISAVGHETDTTLIDYVSDRRAPTPTAAAEIAVPVKDDLLAAVYDIKKRLFSSITRLIDEKTSYLQALSRGLLSPKQLFETMVQRLDDWSERLNLSFSKSLDIKQNKLDVITARLQPQNILNLIELKKQKLLTNARLLDSYHYKKVLSRGFALVTANDGKIVSSINQISSGAKLEIELKDGKKSVIADGAPKVTKQKVKKPTDNNNQGSLF